MKYRHRVLGFLCLLAVITYLDRVAISGRAAHSGKPAPQLGATKCLCVTPLT